VLNRTIVREKQLHAVLAPRARGPPAAAARAPAALALPSMVAARDSTSQHGSRAHAAGRRRDPRRRGLRRGGSVSDVERRVLDAVSRAMVGSPCSAPVTASRWRSPEAKTASACCTPWRRCADVHPFPGRSSASRWSRGSSVPPSGRWRPEVNALGVPWIVRDDAATLRLVADGVAHGCDVCSRHRRRSLYQIADEVGCTVLALVTPRDDCAESLLRNVLFNGRIASLPPVAESRKGRLRSSVLPCSVQRGVDGGVRGRARLATRRACAASGTACGGRSATSLWWPARPAHRGGGVDHGALGNVNPYTLLRSPCPRTGADVSPAFVETIE
jgi:hypothetical protein